MGGRWRAWKKAQVRRAAEQLQAGGCNAVVVVCRSPALVSLQQPGPLAVLCCADDGEAAAAAAVAAGASARQPRLWYGSHTLIDEWVHVVLQPQAAASAQQ